MDNTVDAAVEHFMTIPWCAQLISSSNLSFDQLYSRAPPAGMPWGSYYGETLNTPDTIFPTLVFYDTPTKHGDMVDEVRVLLTLNGKLDSHPGFCHGGVTMGILDEVGGQLGIVNQRHGGMPMQHGMTANMNINFRKPIMVPSTVLARGRFSKKNDGRKWFLQVSIEDENGKVLADTDSLYLSIGTRL